MRFNVVFAFIVMIVLAGCQNERVILSSIETIAEYGTYFGMQRAEMGEESAKYVREGLRVSIQVLDNESVDDFVDVEKVLQAIPEKIRPYIQEAIEVVNKRYIKLHGKIPVDKAPYVRAILNGSFAASKSYVSSLEPAVQGLGHAVYEKQLVDRYAQAQKIK